MSIASDAVPVFRTFWADRFIDSGTLRRETAEGTYNASTLQIDSATVAVVFAGLECLIRPRNRNEQDFGEQRTDVEEYSILVPATSNGARTGDEFTVDVCTYDPYLVGKVLVIREINEDSYLTRYEWVAERIRPSDD